MFSPASHRGAQPFAFGKLNRIVEFQAAGHADRFFGISPGPGIERPNCEASRLTRSRRMAERIFSNRGKC
jgi:hypothetical protein